MQIPKPDLHRVRMVQKQQNPTSSEKKNRSPHMTAAGKKNRVVYRSRATNRLRNTPEERVTQNKQTLEVSVRFLHATASVRVEEDLQTFFNGSAQNLSLQKIATEKLQNWLLRFQNHQTSRRFKGSADSWCACISMS